MNDIIEAIDQNKSNKNLQSQKEKYLTEEFVDPDKNTKLYFKKREKRKWNVFKIMLIFMSIVLLVISIGFLISYLLIESVPTLYTDS